MRTITQLHQEHSSLESEIRFYSLEINFLLKILTKEYTVMIGSEKIRVLDAFWKEFEIYSQKLKAISEALKADESELFLMQKYKNDNTSLITIKEAELRSELNTILTKLKILKETLYEYLENNHYENS